MMLPEIGQLLSRLSLRSTITSCMLNKNQVANAWVGSYRIRNPSEYLDTFPKPKRWPRYNEIVQPPQLDPTSDPRPATYHYFVENVKTSPKKMWYAMKFVRGMNVDEAIKQCRFMPFKPAQLTADALEEARDKALKDHNFEFKSNMWIEDAICSKGLVIKGLRKHARMRFGEVRWFYSHIMIKLTEGEAPKNFYRPPDDGNDMLRKFYNDLRSRKIEQGL